MTLVRSELYTLKVSHSNYHGGNLWTPSGWCRGVADCLGEGATLGISFFWFPSSFANKCPICEISLLFDAFGARCTAETTFLGLGEEGVTRFDVALVEVDDVEKPFSARDRRSRRRRADADSNLSVRTIICSVQQQTNKQMQRSIWEVGSSSAFNHRLEASAPNIYCNTKPVLTHAYSDQQSGLGIVIGSSRKCLPSLPWWQLCVTLIGMGSPTGVVLHLSSDHHKHVFHHLIPLNYHLLAP